MGRNIFLMIVLLTIIVSTFMFNNNEKQLKLIDGVNQDINMLNASYIASTYFYIIKNNYLDKITDDQFKLFIQKTGKYNNQIDSTSIKIYARKIVQGSYQIKCIVGVYNAMCQLTMQYNKMPYSQYALFVDSFPNSYFGTGQVFNGPIYINGSMGVGNMPGPIFYDNVYCTGTIKYYDGASSKNFKGFKASVYQNYDYLSMPKDNTHIGMSQYKNIAYNISDIDQIVLRYDLVLCYKNNNFIKRLNVDSLIAYKNILYNNNSLNKIKVSGVLEGQLTIASQGDIIIKDNIMYSDAYQDGSSQLFAVPSDSKNLLALVTDGIVDISKQANTLTLNTTYDVLVCASIFTTKKLNVTQQYFQLKPSADQGGGMYQRKIRKLIVFGSRTQGYMDNVTYVKNKYGLAQIVNYDKRLKYLKPNGVPYTDKGGRIVYWKQYKKYLDTITY